MYHMISGSEVFMHKVYVDSIKLNLCGSLCCFGFRRKPPSDASLTPALDLGLAAVLTDRVRQRYSKIHQRQAWHMLTHSEEAPHSDAGKCRAGEEHFGKRKARFDPCWQEGVSLFSDFQT